ncbi:MAG TPA: hypothetical protein DDW91_17780 [Shewanella frigidimarina]|nr:hypothetical protein [Shewanella frigidimarina]
MLTVKEFKDLGVKFVAGDERSSSTYRHGDVEMTDVLANGTNCSDGTDREVINSFAWRSLNTLPDNSNFKIEFKNSDSEFEKEMWRPLLDQSALKPVNDASVKPSDCKPVFTQAMADAGELPPVGSKLLYSNLANPKEIDWREVESKYIDDDCIFFKGVNGVKGFASKADMFGTFFKPLDTRTPKQKAVDELTLCILSAPVTIDSIGMAKMLYDKGYRK